MSANKSPFDEQFPRAAQYDPEWVAANEMGPNVLWLMEFLTSAWIPAPGARVLDLGCGTAVSSIYLARELGAQVWAADLWIPPTDNWQRIQTAGLTDSVFPIYAEAHTLPFAHGFFDVLLSVDAYHYFGTDDGYLPYVLAFLKEGARIGFVVPGLRAGFDGGVPDYLQPEWQADLFTLHSAAWWRNHLNKTGLVDVRVADHLENGWQMWRYWEEYLVATKQMNPGRGDDLALLEADAGRNLTFVRVLAIKR